MNRKQLEEMFDEQFKDMYRADLKGVKNFIFKKVIPKVLKSVVPKEEEGKYMCHEDSYVVYTVSTDKNKALIHISLTKKNFKETYTLRARIGIYIGVLLCLIYLEFIKE